MPAAQTIHKPGSLLAWLVLGSCALFGSIYLVCLYEALSGKISGAGAGLFAFKTAVEILISSYGFAFLFGAVAYWRIKSAPPPPPTGEPPPPVGIIYLCCEDLDVEALESLCRVRYQGRLTLIVHDDSRSETSRRAVEAAVSTLRQTASFSCLLLRRPTQEGGKPSALNYVLEQTSGLYDFFLLCDNDSTLLDPLTLERALAYFQDPKAAVVQFRTVGLQAPEYCGFNRLLAHSIDAFHVFLNVQARFGWRPFIGHNALLRTRAVVEAGGFTPGFFADDLDLTVRLNLKGYSVVYAGDIHMAEKHPASYDAFRKRTCKWAYGCLQILRRHGGTVLGGRSFSLAEKFSFLHFTGFYLVQALLILYLAVTFLALPFVMRDLEFGLGGSLLAGSVILLLIFLPVLSYFFKERRGRGCLSSLAACALVYGTTDFSCAKGIWDCLRNRKVRWVPTNQAGPERRPRRYTGEALFGALLLVVPLWSCPSLLYVPCVFLFAGKYLFIPAVALLYDDARPRRAAEPASLRPAWAVFRRVLGRSLPCWLALATTLFFQGDWTVAAGPVEIKGPDLYVQDRLFFVKGIHYGPWRPGTGPNKGYPYPGPDHIKKDFSIITNLHANTVLVYDPPAYVLDIAQQSGLKLLYCFTINWWALGAEAGAEADADADARRDILNRVQQLRHKPALLAWVLGNEIPSAAVQQRGTEVFERGLRQLYDAIKAVDPHHPVTHCNWPPTRELRLPFLDIISFNVYPLWPPEVVAQGYGAYLKTVVRPLAGPKPLLITEFGINSLEAGLDGQSRLLVECWRGVREAGTCGGVVFEFADEWWKNYDNPRRAGDWWYRLPAPADEQQHDLDPEEHYGIFTSRREPKPTATAVQEMFKPESPSAGRVLVTTMVGGLLLASLAAWCWAAAIPSRRAACQPERHSKEAIIDKGSPT